MPERITYEGVTRTASEWVELLGVSVAAVHGHYRRKSTLQTFKTHEMC